MKLGDSDMRLVFNNLWTQRLLLIVFTVAIFWHGLWGGVPRADQLSYLHQVSQYNNLDDILLNSPSWNRTQANIGDAILYRPIIYLQLGIFYYLFRYNFILWQLASLVLHILVVLGLHSLFLQTIFRKTSYSFLFSLLFGSSLLGSDCVFWSNISGYLTFSIFAVYSVICLVKYFTMEKKDYAYVAIFLGFTSEFIYEIGFLLNLMIAMTLLYDWIFIKHKRNLIWMIIILAGIVIYPIISVFDLWLLGYDSVSKIIQFDHSQKAFSEITNILFYVYKILLGICYAVIQIVFWLIGWLLPSLYDVRAMARLYFFRLQLTEILLIPNYVALFILFYIIIYLIETKSIKIVKINRKGLFAALCPIIFIFTYSLFLAYGRSIPRGIMYLLNNTYYSYIFYLAIMIILALYTIDYYYAANASENTPQCLDMSNKNKLYLKIIIPLLVMMIISINAYYTFKIALNYRYKYSAPRQELIDTVEKWLQEEGKAKNTYFRIKEECLGNDSIKWFSNGYGHFRKNSGWSGPVKMIDILFPEKSFRLNERNIQANHYTVFDIKCPNN